MDFPKGNVKERAVVNFSIAVICALSTICESEVMPENVDGVLQIGLCLALGDSRRWPDVREFLVHKKWVVCSATHVQSTEKGRLVNAEFAKVLADLQKEMKS